MSTDTQLLDWMKELTGDNDRLVRAWREYGRSHAILATATHHYHIAAVFPGEREDSPYGYLGCIASSRVIRAGESRTRGNDLADGPFSRETWDRIVRDIVRYELVAIEAQQEPQEAVAVT